MVLISPSQSVVLPLVRAHRRPYIPFLLIILEVCYPLFLLELRSFLCNAGLRKNDANEFFPSNGTSFPPSARTHLDLRRAAIKQVAREITSYPPTISNMNEDIFFFQLFSIPLHASYRTMFPKMLSILQFSLCLLPVQSQLNLLRLNCQFHRNKRTWISYFSAVIQENIIKLITFLQLRL